MNAEIISVGSELVTGQALDTNSQWLSRRLAEIGIAVRWHTTVADDLEENVQAFRIAGGRADLILVTGGLGPTQDDLTRESLAKMAGVELVFHEPSYEQIKQVFASRSRTMPERNRVQAMFPAGSEPIPNAVGTAPGIWMAVLKSEGGRGREGEGEKKSAADVSPSPSLPLPHSLFVAMPGVPGEMFAMFEGHVKPRLQQWAGPAGIVIERKINCFGAGESAIEEKVLDLTRRGHVPEVGITVSDATISFRIVARAATAADARLQIEPVEQTLRARLGDLVFGVDSEELQDAVAALLAARRLTIATAESITGGLVAHRLVLVSGISQWFKGGVIAYDNAVKVEMLSVPENLLKEHGAVSAETAEAMAEGCRARFQTDLALSTTGIAGPTGATPTKPIGLAYVGLAWKDGVRSQRFHWFGNRAEIQSRVAKMALNMARLHLHTSGERRGLSPPTS